MLTSIAIPLLAILIAFLIRYFFGDLGWVTALAYYLVAWIGTMHFLDGSAHPPVPEMMTTLSSALSAWVLAGESVLVRRKDGGNT